MSMSIHIGMICSKAFYGLYKIRQIRKFLNPESTKTLVHAFVTSHLGNCEEELPKKPVGRLSVDCRPTVDRQVTDSLPTDNRQVTGRLRKKKNCGKNEQLT